MTGRPIPTVGEGPGAVSAVIEFFFSRDCPSHERALGMLHDEMAKTGIDISRLRVIEVASEADAARLAFPGSPTIRVDGTDLQRPVGEVTGLSCRLYSHRDGRPSPLPDVLDLRDALQAHARNHQR